tara:strand:+ start:4391 stop:4570 length:180 start_codon:yes stop_codon:yes gene_type:complete
MSEEIEKDMQDMQTNSIEEDIKYRQGRSKYRVEQTEIAAGVCFAIYIILLTIIWYISHI